MLKNPVSFFLIEAINYKSYFYHSSLRIRLPNDSRISALVINDQLSLPKHHAGKPK